MRKGQDMKKSIAAFVLVGFFIYTNPVGAEMTSTNYQIRWDSLTEGVLIHPPQPIMAFMIRLVETRLEIQQARIIRRTVGIALESLIRSLHLTFCFKIRLTHAQSQHEAARPFQRRQQRAWLLADMLR